MKAGRGWHLKDKKQSLLQLQKETEERVIGEIDNWAKDLTSVTNNEKHNKAVLKLLNYLLSLKQDKSAD